MDTLLLPNLSNESVIVMDNAIFHKGKEMEKLIENAGHSLLYLPLYSPDLNSIEKKWAQTKHIRCKTGCSIDQVFNSFLT